MPMIETRLGHRAAPKILMFRRLNANRQQDFKRRVWFCTHERRKGPGVETCLLKCILDVIARTVRPRMDGVRHDAMPKATAAVVVFRDSH